MVSRKQKFIKNAKKKGHRKSPVKKKAVKYKAPKKKMARKKATRKTKGVRGSIKFPGGRMYDKEN